MQHLVFFLIYRPIYTRSSYYTDLLRIGDFGSTWNIYIYSSLFVLLKNWRIMFHKNIQNLCKISQEIQIGPIWSEFPLCLVVLESWPKICQNLSFRHFLRPRKKPRTCGKNQSHHDNTRNLLYILANFYMSAIFSSLNILVQTQIRYYPTLTNIKYLKWYG